MFVCGVMTCHRRHDEVADGDLPRERGRSERNDLGHAEPARALELGAIPANAQAAGEGRAGRRAARARVRRVELADHLVHEAHQLIGRLRALRERRVLGAHRIPVHAVHLLVEEVVAQLAPHEREELSRSAVKSTSSSALTDTGRTARAGDIDGGDASRLNVVDLLSIRRPLHAASWARAWM